MGRSAPGGPWDRPWPPTPIFPPEGTEIASPSTKTPFLSTSGAQPLCSTGPAFEWWCDFGGSGARGPPVDLRGEGSKAAPADEGGRRRTVDGGLRRRVLTKEESSLRLGGLREAGQDHLRGPPPDLHADPHLSSAKHQSVASQTPPPGCLSCHGVQGELGVRV